MLVQRFSCTQHVVTAIRRASTARKPPTLKNQPPPRQPPATRPAQESTNSTLSQQAPPTSSPQAPQKLSRSHAVPWVLASIIAGGIAFYGTRLFIAARQPCHDAGIADLANQKDVAARYDDTADSFDSEVGLSELLMGINGMRKKLARQCVGHVLEVSCGTGRNLGYYEIGRAGSEVASLTFVDLSPAMVAVCKRKWASLYEGKADKLRQGLVVRFLAGSALDALPPPPKPAAQPKYDTVIQTMGLCSTPAPAALLENMVAHLDTTNSDARILLLEHGRSYRAWLNRILDNSAAQHAELHGCWFNRDVGQLVADLARQTGMEVVHERRRHFGTTLMFEMRPSAELVTRSRAAREAEVATPTTSDRGWWSWMGGIVAPVLSNTTTTKAA